VGSVFSKTIHLLMHELALRRNMYKLIVLSYIYHIFKTSLNMATLKHLKKMKLVNA